MADMSVSLQMSRSSDSMGKPQGHLGQHTSQFQVEPNLNLLKSPTKDKRSRNCSLLYWYLSALEQLNFLFCNGEEKTFADKKVPASHFGVIL
jgi:hypothetical protein